MVNWSWSLHLGMGEELTCIWLHIAYQFPKETTAPVLYSSIDDIVPLLLPSLASSQKWKELWKDHGLLALSRGMMHAWIHVFHKAIKRRHQSLGCGHVGTTSIQTILSADDQRVFLATYAAFYLVFRCSSPFFTRKIQSPAQSTATQSYKTLLLVRVLRNAFICCKYTDFSSIIFIVFSIYGNFLVSIHSQNWHGYNKIKITINSSTC
jgi:hypothetical protein